MSRRLLRLIRAVRPTAGPRPPSRRSFRTGLPGLTILAALLPVVAQLQGCAVLGTPPVVAECRAPVAPDRPGHALVGQNYGMAMTPLPLNSVQFGSTAAARMVAVQSLSAVRTDTDTVRLQARFLSCGDIARTLRVRVSFLRADTSPAEPPSAWQPLYLAPRALALYTEHAAARDVTSYLVEVAE